MSKRIVIFDEAYRLLEEAQGQRIEDGWKRGCSLEQIASEAIIFWSRQGDNTVCRDVTGPDRVRSLLEGVVVGHACPNCGSQYLTTVDKNEIRCDRCNWSGQFSSLKEVKAVVH